MFSLLQNCGAQALIFDMDGTLADNMGWHREAWLEWARVEGLSMDEETLLNQTHGTVWEITARLFPGDSPETLRERAARKEETYRRIAAPHLALLPGLRAILEEAKRREIPLALATAGDWNNIRFTLEKCGLEGVFDAIIGADDVENGKPHPEVFLKAAQKLGVEAGACLVLEDSPEGAQAARRAGMKCVIVNAMRAPERYTGNPAIQAFFRDFSEVTL